MGPIRSIAIAIGTAILFSTAAIAAELERVAIDSASPHVTTYVAIPKGMPEGEIQRINAKLQEQKSVYIVEWSSFVADLEKHVNFRILKNEYPEYRTADGLVALLQKFPLTPFSLTWNGGVALTFMDHRHAQETYQRYLKDTTVTTRPADRRADPVHPENHIGSLLGR
jgi:hypothetical protein